MHAANVDTASSWRRVFGLALLCLWFAGQSAGLMHSHDGSFAQERCAQCAASHLDDQILDAAERSATLPAPAQRMSLLVAPAPAAASFAHYAPRAPPSSALI